MNGDAQKTSQFLNSDMLLILLCKEVRALPDKMRRRIRWLRRDEFGGLEGLPLYLIILITITAIALVVIIGLIPRPLIPNSMTIDVTDGPGASTDVLCWSASPTGNPQDVTITVFTRDNVAINDAVVRLNGAGLDVALRTRDGGKATFDNLITYASGNPQSTTVNVEATFGGVTIGDQIPVNRAGQGGCP